MVSTIPEINGWIESSQDWSVNELYRFEAYWNVPSYPPSPEIDTVDFLFNGIQPSDGSAIIVQPVLEWNNAGSGRWTGAAWSVSPGDTYHSSRINVDTSDEIEGLMYWNTFQNKWFIGFWDHTTDATTYIYSTAIGTSDLAVFTALEGYGVNDDTDVPGDTTFHSMDFRDSNNNIVDITWVPNIPPQNELTGLNVEIFSDQKVKLHTAN